MPDDATVAVRYLVEGGGTRTDLAVAFTDLEGFTAFTVAEGDDAAARVLLAHHRHADRLARRRGGRVVKRPAPPATGARQNCPEAAPTTQTRHEQRRTP